MPHFKNLSKSALAKLSYFFQRKTYLRNQLVFKEGEDCKFVYIVYKGEFEVVKSVNQFERYEQTKEKIVKYLGQ